MGHRAVKAKYGSVKKFKEAQVRAAATGQALPPLTWQPPKRAEWKPRHRGE